VEWVKAQSETKSEQTAEIKAEAPEDALDKDLDSFASPKVTEQTTHKTIDTQIIEEFRGLRKPHEIKLLCVTAESVGLTGVNLRDIVKKATGGEVLTQVTYDKVMSTLQQMAKKS
jgi:hypothetical protein